MPIERVIVDGESFENELHLSIPKDDNLKMHIELTIHVPHGYDASIWLDDDDMELIIERWKKLKKEREYNKTTKEAINGKD